MSIFFILTASKNKWLTKLLVQYIELHTVLLIFSMQHFGKLGINLNDLVVKVLDSQSKSPVFKTIGWIRSTQPFILLRLIK